MNVALVDFLNAVRWFFVRDSDWSFERKAFQIGNKKSGQGFEARVDGLLRRVSDNNILAIVEVKPCVRLNQATNIRMQESAQMAAWISDFPDNCINPDSDGNFM